MNKEHLMQAAQTAGIEDIELYASSSKTTTLQIYEQKVDSFKISECKGIQARGIYQGKMGTCYLEEDSDDAIAFIIEQIKQNASAITSSDEVEIYAGEEVYPTLEHTKNACIDAPVEKKITMMMELEKKLQESDARIEQVMDCAYQDIEMAVQIHNSKGVDIARQDDFTIVSAGILVKDGEDQKSAYDVVTLKSLEDFDLDAFVETLKHKAIAKLHATQVESGMYPVLMEKDAMGSLLQYLCSLLDGESAYKGISLLKDKLGTQIFDEKITWVDDPLIKDGYNSAAFDDEGVASKRKVLVEKGVLTSYLHNLKSAKLMKCTSTGNGFGGGISPTNLYVENGDTGYDDMIAKMDKGIIITELNGLHAGLNTMTTQFSLQAAGFYVEGGKIQRPINLITVAGVFLDMMKDITCVGNDLKFQLSGIGSPSILFPALAISGE